MKKLDMAKGILLWTGLMMMIGSPIFIGISYQEDKDKKEQKLRDACGNNKDAWTYGECKFSRENKVHEEDYDDHKAEILGKEGQDTKLSSKQICKNLDGDWNSGDCDFPNNIKGDRDRTEFEDSVCDDEDLSKDFEYC
jgi:hypothetical protein